MKHHIIMPQFYISMEKRRRGGPAEYVPYLTAWCRQRSVSGRKYVFPHFWAIPGAACRGHLARISSSKQQFRQEKMGEG